MPPYSLQNVVASYRWLGHRAPGLTELNAYHRDYRPGREHFEWNAEHGLFPIIGYASSEQDVVRFVQRHHAYRMLCYGINPRPAVFRNRTGRPRSAREPEIAASQNLVLDIDIASKEPSQAQIAALGAFLNRADSFFLDQQLNAPVTAYTGRGYHLLLAFPAIAVSDCPDIASRLKRFSTSFRNAYRRELAALDARLDNTHDLRRMVKMYGTAKPLVQIISEFYGSERLEDERLAAYLLGLPSQGTQEPQRNLVLHPAADIPLWFAALLETDERTAKVWAGTGKTGGDTSRSGYDYSLVSRLVHLGHTNPDELATILALRPEGSVQKGGKGIGYLRRTIGNVLLEHQQPQRSPRTEETA